MDHPWFDGIDWSDVKEQWLYVKEYKPKSIADKSDQIDFDSIIGKKQERDGELEDSHISGWSFFHDDFVDSSEEEEEEEEQDEVWKNE